jgi:hypothetical protein
MVVAWLCGEWCDGGVVVVWRWREWFDGGWCCGGVGMVGAMVAVVWCGVVVGGGGGGGGGGEVVVAWW